MNKPATRCARDAAHGGPTPLLVLGLGNVLLQDDGVGSKAVDQLLDRYEPPAGIRVLDGGTLGLSLLPYLEDAERVILVDAVRTDAPPGTLVRLDGGEVMPAVATRLSPHQVGVLDLLDGARFHDRLPSSILLLGIVPAGFDLSLELTAAVAAALPALVEAIVDETARLGLRFANRRGGRKPRTSGALEIARLRDIPSIRASNRMPPFATREDATRHRP
jgi:hydrogenase maturation protease